MTGNTRTLVLMSTIAVGMLSLGFYSKTLYDTFCKLTGFGGTPRVAQYSDNLNEIIDREIKVSFDTNVSPDLPWSFKPEVRSLTVKMGQDAMAYYSVRNESDKPITGVATFNVTPVKAAPYFVKTECFCFTDQTIQPGEEVSFPVIFYVDPEMDESPRHDEVREVYLSYTFFESENQPEADVGPGTAKALD